MNYAVEGQLQDPAKVVREFRAAHGLQKRLALTRPPCAILNSFVGPNTIQCEKVKP